MRERIEGRDVEGYRSAFYYKNEDSTTENEDSSMILQ